MNQKRYLLVDICWTLFYSNTTFDFLDFFVRKDSYRRIRRFFSSRIVSKVNLLIYKLFQIDLQRVLCIRYLKGYSHEQLSASAEQFYQEYLVPRRIEPAWSLLSDKDIVTVSGTLDIIAETVARHIGAQSYFASKLAYKNGLCTGRFTDFLLDKKKVLNTFERFDIITDNLTDIDLIRQAEEVTIITYQNRARWERILPANKQPHYIEAATERY